MTKTNILISGLVLLGLILFQFFKIQQYKSFFSSEKQKSDSLYHSLLYMRFKSIGDSLMITGAHSDAIKYYLKADSVLGESKLAEETKKHAEVFEKRRDSLQQLDLKLRRIKNEFYSLKNKQEANSIQKDSVIETSKEEIFLLKSKIQEARDSLVKARKEIKKISQSVGKLEIEVYNGTKVFYAGDISNGKANGFGYGLFNTGGIYEGEWKNNLRHGKGKYTWKDGNMYEGEYYDDKRQGKGTYFFNSGEKYVGEWMDNKRNGKGKMYDKDGTIIVNGKWENDEFID